MNVKYAFCKPRQLRILGGLVKLPRGVKPDVSPWWFWNWLLGGIGMVAMVGWSSNLQQRSKKWNLLQWLKVSWWCAIIYPDENLESQWAFTCFSHHRTCDVPLKIWYIEVNYDATSRIVNPNGRSVGKFTQNYLHEGQRNRNVSPSSVDSIRMILYYHGHSL